MQQVQQGSPIQPQPLVKNRLNLFNNETTSTGSQFASRRAYLAAKAMHRILLGSEIAIFLLFRTAMAKYLPPSMIKPL